MRVSEAPAAVHGQYLVPRFQPSLAAERAILDGVDDPAGDGFILGRNEDDHDHEAQQKVHERARRHDECPLPNRRFVQRLSGALLRRDGVLFLRRSVVFAPLCLLALGAFLPFQRDEPAHRQGTDAVLRPLVELLPQNRTHADGKFIDLHSAELCHRKVAELVDGDHRTEHKHRSKERDEN
mgnify:CR=1 FL=1